MYKVEQFTRKGGLFKGAYQRIAEELENKLNEGAKKVDTVFNSAGCILS